MTIMEDLDNLLELHAEAIHAIVGAGSTDTHTDRENAHVADSKYVTALEEFEKRLGKCVEIKG